MLRIEYLSDRERRINCDLVWKAARRWAKRQKLEENCHVAGGIPL